jgi:F-type H+-transporting ATPase subunit delta
MSLRTSANRYAKALFDVVLEEKGDLAKVDQDLIAIVETFATHASLMPAAERAGVPDANRKAVMEQVAEQLGVAVPVKKLAVMLTERRRLELFEHIAEAFRERLLAHQQVVRADVTSAAPLSADRTAALAASLSKVTGKKVELSVSVDPGLLGGVIARIGSTVYDGSVKTQLAHMRQELVKQ